MSIHGTDTKKSTYDATGLRVKKDASGYDYPYDGSGEWTYYVHDHLGSVRAVIDSLGNTKETYDYDPFGKLLRASLSGIDPSEIRYTGYEIENESDSLDGVYFANARMYDSEIGRFLSPDPAGQGHSPYTYAGNNPIGITDPTGMFTKNVAAYNEMKMKGYRDFYQFISEEDEEGNIIDQYYLLRPSLLSDWYRKSGSHRISVEEWKALPFIREDGLGYNWDRDGYLRFEKAPPAIMPPSALDQEFILWEYDEYGILIGAHSSMAGFDPFRDFLPHPAYFWATSNLENAVPEGETGRPLTQEEMTIIAWTLYNATKYGGEEGRKSALGYHGYTIWAQKNIKMMGRLAYGINDRNNKTIQFLDPKLHAYSDKEGDVLSGFMRSVIHEGLHEYPEYDDYGESWDGSTLNIWFSKIAYNAANSVYYRMNLMAPSYTLYPYQHYYYGGVWWK